MPESPSPLLGRDILSEVQISIFMNTEPDLSLPLIEQNVNAVLVIINLKDPHLFPHQKEYPLKPLRKG